MKIHYCGAIVTFCVTVVAIGNACAESRTWTDNTGGYSVEAELERVTDTEVILRNAKGEAIHVPLKRLSKADLEFLKSQQRTTKSKPKATASSTATQFLKEPVVRYLQSKSGRGLSEHKLSWEKPKGNSEFIITARVAPHFKGRATWIGKCRTTGRIQQAKATIRLRNLKEMAPLFSGNTGSIIEESSKHDATKALKPSAINNVGRATSSSLTIRIRIGKATLTTHEVFLPGSLLTNDAIEQFEITTSWTVDGPPLRQGRPMTVDFSQKGKGLYGVVGSGYYSHVELLGTADAEMPPDKIIAFKK